MKKTFALIVIMLTVFTVLHAQDAYPIRKIDRNISLRFPEKANESLPGSLIAANKDSSVVYIVTVVDFKTAAGIDSAGLAPIQKTPEFAAQLKTGIQSTLHDVDLADLTLGTWHGYTSYSTKGPGIGVKKNKLFSMFMLLIGTKYYCMSTIVNATASPKITEDYFSSITLNH